MNTWILFTLLAVLMQSLRTAGQKQISKTLSVEATTFVRFLFGLPFALLYFLFAKKYYQVDAISAQGIFFLWASLAAMAQIVATLLLVKALGVRNFAVGTSLAKTEAIMTALFGAWFFSASLSWVGYCSVIIGVAGTLIASKWKMSFQDLRENQSIKFGLGAGIGFALASLWLKEASMSLHLVPQLGAAVTLVVMVSMQTAICFVWIVIYQRSQLQLILQKMSSCWFIGLTSVAGSIGWFTAISLQNAALVKTLGQTEFFVTIAITYFYFGEKISREEYLGMSLVSVSVLLLLFYA